MECMFNQNTLGRFFMLSFFNLESSDTLLLNLTSTLLGDDINESHIFFRNIGIKRRLSHIKYLFSFPERNDDEKLDLLNLEQGCEEKAILGYVGKSQIAILPKRIPDLLKHEELYAVRRELIWGVLSWLNQTQNTTKVLSFPENEPSHWDDFGEHGLAGVLNPLRLKLDHVGNNFSLCNPVYYPLLIVGTGLSQDEFSHVELYMRYGGNVLLNVDSVCFEEQVDVSGGCMEQMNLQLQCS